MPEAGKMDGTGRPSGRLAMAVRRRRSIAGMSRVAALGATVGIAVLGSGCNNAGEGALSGAALGAAGGAAIGSLYGDLGKGAVIGAVAGGLGGAVMGDQNERRDRDSWK